jgi:hypothetical protein
MIGGIHKRNAFDWSTGNSMGYFMQNRRTLVFIIKKTGKTSNTSIRTVIVKSKISQVNEMKKSRSWV